MRLKSTERRHLLPIEISLAAVAVTLLGVAGRVVAAWFDV